MLNAVSGGTLGFAASLPVIVAYGIWSLVRRLAGQRESARSAPRPRSQWHWAFSALVLASSLCLAYAIYPHPACTFPGAMVLVAFMGLIFRVGWFVPCLAAGADAGLILAELIRSGPLGWQMTVVSTAVFMGVAFGCGPGSAYRFDGEIAGCRLAKT